MSGGCARFEQALRRGDSAAFVQLREHAPSCSECAERLALWDAIDHEAAALHTEWESPGLMPRFAAGLEAEKARGSEPAAEAVPPARRRRPWIGIAAAASLFVLSMIGLRVFQTAPPRDPLVAGPSKDPLLSEQSLTDIETAEANYIRSIDALSEIARPRIENPTTPLFVSYREKLLVLDSAIAEMRTQIESNRFNSHLRSELLAMYQEKQRTLQQLMKEDKS